MGTEARGRQFKLLGGSLPLDFVNTVDWRLADRPVELLESYEDLISWGVQAGLLAESQALALREAAARRPREADAALAKAIQWREILFRLLVGFLRHGAVDPLDLAAFNAAVQDALSRIRLVPAESGLAWGWPEGEGLDSIVRPVIHAAAQLLTSPAELRRVKMCSDALCGWLFLDRSKNESRLWCSMRDCGNRAKARRFYRKAKSRRSNP
ncbi:MAG: CGNR zinc finger domain-containing protein [Betaproteobacteria bacterium]